MDRSTPPQSVYVGASITLVKLYEEPKRNGKILFRSRQIACVLLP
ncbi:hypothetical protein Goari_003391, partial [Gossypium aridum]|nr:hypothetical protein [Gossypium aridum]